MKEIRISEELRANISEKEDEKKTRMIEGYASVANKPTVIWYFEEVIAKGAFTRVLEELERGEQDVRALFNHDANYVLGRTAKDGFPATLILREDEKGLWTQTEAPPLGENPLADTVVSNIKRGAVTGMSFAFTVSKQEWEFFDSPEQMDRRTITEVGMLYDVGPVTYPAYPQTTVGVRMKELAKKEHDEARGRWESRRKSSIVVPSGFEHSLFEARATIDGDWQVVEVKRDDEAIKDEENTKTVEEQGEVQSQEGAEAQGVEVEPVKSVDGESGSENIAELDESATVESESRNRQIALKRLIARASLATKSVLDKK